MTYGPRAFDRQPVGSDADNAAESSDGYDPIQRQEIDLADDSHRRDLLGGAASDDGDWVDAHGDDGDPYERNPREGEYRHEPYERYDSFEGCDPYDGGI